MKVHIALIGLLSTFLLATSILYYVSTLLPQSSNGRYGLKFPSNLDELKKLATFLKQYKEEQKIPLMLLFCTAYLYKQTFAIPGSVFMNLLAGALFGLWKAFFITCILTASGATCCYFISKIFGESILSHYFPERVKDLQDKLRKNKDGLFFFLICLRLFPMSPNWFLNMTSPILGISIFYFFPTVLIGLMPYNFICCQTGCILSELQSMNDILTPYVALKLAGIALGVALPGLLMRRLNASQNSKSK